MIEIKKINKKYGDTIIFENASYVLPNTGLICLVGESGSGKTTLMRILAGLDKDYSGEVIVNGKLLKKLDEDDLCNYRKDYVGFVFQEYNLLKNYTVLENILYPCILNENNVEETKTNAKKLLKDFSIAEKENVKVENLSGGQKQRVAIARALINKPDIILADEPTGALDRKTSNEIMQILKDISKEKLVFIITHDKHICKYADEVISIDNKKINIDETNSKLNKKKNKELELKPYAKINYSKLAIKNYKVSFLKYFVIALTFAISIMCFILSLSSGKIVQKEIDKFKDKNTAFNSIYIKNDGNIDEIYDFALSDERIENVYKQYKIKDIKLTFLDVTEKIEEKYPMSKATETMSYGVMPRKDKKEIALTPSLAKKFSSNISELIGKKMDLKYNDKIYSLTISGIYNALYDDFFVSSDIEQEFYKQVDSENYYSINFDVKKFEDIVPISDELLEKEIKVKTAKEEVEAIQITFEKISKLFTIISLMVLMISIFIIVILLKKLKQTRLKMIKILSVLGFNKKTISKLLIYENSLLIINSFILISAFIVIWEILI